MELVSLFVCYFPFVLAGSGEVMYVAASPSSSMTNFRLLLPHLT